MGSSSQPEIAVRLGVTTSAMDAGFGEAVRKTEQGVAQMNAALSKLEAAQIQSEMWTRRRAAAERDAYGVAQRMAAVQTTVAATVRTVAAASDVSGARMASATGKAIMFTNALATAGTVNGSVAAKFLNLAGSVSGAFGPAGIAAVAVTGFAALVMSKMGKVRDELEETKKKWTETIDALVNAGDIAELTRQLRDVQEGTRAKNYEDGTNAAYRRVAALKAERDALEQRGALFAALAVQEKLDDEQAALDALIEKYKELRKRILEIPGAQSVRGMQPVTITADAPGAGGKPTGPTQAQLLKDAAALDQAYYDRAVAAAGDSYERRHALAVEWLVQQSAIYGADSAEYVKALAAIEEMDRQEQARKLEENAQEYRDYVAHLNAIDALEREAQAERVRGWTEALDKIHAVLDRSFSGFFALNETLMESFRNLGRGMLGAMVNAAIESAKAWIVSALVTQAAGETTAKKTVINSAVEAAARAWAATVGIPVVGPVLAPVAAAASFAGVLAFGGSIASAAGGWDNVPADQLAMVHKNEMILPAPLAESLRAMAGTGGGGGSRSISINALDAQSFEQALRRNDSTLARVIQEMLRNGQLSLA